MDRIALAKRLESLSSVFASHTPYNRDLRAMSYVLNKMADDKFTSIISGDFSSDDLEACMCGGGKGPGGPLPGIVPVGGPVDESKGLPGGEPKVIVIKKEEEMPMSAEATEKTAGMFWCKEASKAVVDNLLRDVVGMNKSQCCDTGRKLESDQVPNGKHDGEKAPTLKPEQTPDDAASIETGMVEKSRGAVKKEATSADELKKMTEEKKKKKALEVLNKDQKKSEKKASEEEGEKAEQEAEKKEEKAKDLLEEAEKDEKKAEKAEGEKAATSETSSMVEGIELMASMDEVELDAGEAAELSKLFE